MGARLHILTLEVEVTGAQRALDLAQVLKTIALAHEGRVQALLFDPPLPDDQADELGLELALLRVADGLAHLAAQVRNTRGPDADQAATSQVVDALLGDRQPHTPDPPPTTQPAPVPDLPGDDLDQVVQTTAAALEAGTVRSRTALQPVLDQLATGPKTGRQLDRALGWTKGRGADKCRRGVDLGLIRVAGTAPREEGVGRPSILYVLTDHPDPPPPADPPPVGVRRGSSRRHIAERAAQPILDLLAIGPLTTLEIADRLGRHRRATNKSLNQAAGVDPPLVIRVGEQPSQSGGRPLVVWALPGTPHQETPDRTPPAETDATTGLMDGHDGGQAGRPIDPGPTPDGVGEQQLRDAGLIAPFTPGPPAPPDPAPSSTPKAGPKVDHRPANPADSDDPLERARARFRTMSDSELEVVCAERKIDLDDLRLDADGDDRDPPREAMLERIAGQLDQSEGQHRAQRAAKKAKQAAGADDVRPDIDRPGLPGQVMAEVAREPGRSSRQIARALWVNWQEVDVVLKRPGAPYRLDDAGWWPA
jgi:hypothetical protein